MDNKETKELRVNLTNWHGKPCTKSDLSKLQTIAKKESDFLAELYAKYDGLQFQINGETAGLVVASVSELEQYNSDWRDWFSEYAAEDLQDFEKEGVAFATIHQSGNYFVMYEGKVYYGDHDGGNDEVWGDSLQDFFTKALSDPPKFLTDAGCYTRYYDGKTDTQYIPEKFESGEA